MPAIALSPFVRAYVECALWSSTDDDGEPLDELYSIDDLAPSALASMIADCDAFQRDNAELLTRCKGPRSEYTAMEYHGHDFWLTRNRHGAGFWDRGYGDEGRKLTDAAQAYAECDLYVGDDGLIYVQ